jgi:hypothetical protein
VNDAFDESGPVEAVGFDFDEVCRNVDGAEPDQSPDPQQSLANLMAWLESPGMVQFLGPTVRLKFAALAWCLDGEQPLSEIATRYGVSKQAVGSYAAQARRIFRLANRAQRTHGNRFKHQATA